MCIHIYIYIYIHICVLMSLSIYIYIYIRSAPRGGGKILQRKYKKNYENETLRKL